MFPFSFYLNTVVAYNTNLYTPLDFFFFQTHLGYHSLLVSGELSAEFRLLFKDLVLSTMLTNYSSRESP